MRWPPPPLPIELASGRSNLYIGVMYSKVLLALDGSAQSRHGGEIALAVAKAAEAEVIACHVCSAQLHGQRFVAMEPGLPKQYQAADSLQKLRLAHDTLITESFQALSVGYMDTFVACMSSAKVAIQGR